MLGWAAIATRRAGSSGLALRAAADHGAAGCACTDMLPRIRVAAGAHRLVEELRLALPACTLLARQTLRVALRVLLSG